MLFKLNNIHVYVQTISVLFHLFAVRRQAQKNTQAVSFGPATKQNVHRRQHEGLYGTPELKRQVHPAVQTPQQSAQHLKFLHQWLGREGTCGGRLCEKTMKRKPWQDFQSVSIHKRISKSHSCQTRQRKSLENIGLHTCVHPSPVLWTAPKQWVTLSVLCVTTGNRSYHGNPQLHPYSK